MSVHGGDGLLTQSHQIPWSSGVCPNCVTAEPEDSGTTAVKRSRETSKQMARNRQSKRERQRHRTLLRRARRHVLPPSPPAKQTGNQQTGNHQAGNQQAGNQQRVSRPRLSRAPAPKLGVKELRALVEKLEQANAKLRAKGRESAKAAKAATARIADLEQQVSQLEKNAAAQPVPATRNAKPKPAATGRSPRKTRGVDPGDAVPPGVAVEKPAPMDKEAETALKNLEGHLGRTQ